jgi:hypothetical protein
MTLLREDRGTGHADGGVSKVMVQQIQFTEIAAQSLPHRHQRKSPWVSDDVLLGLSIWWVRVTHPGASDFGAEVAMTFDGLQRDLQ